jgi:hypothetical protein
MRDELSAACHDALFADPGAAGRKKVCALIRQPRTQTEFAAAHLGNDTPEPKIRK